MWKKPKTTTFFYSDRPGYAVYELSPIFGRGNRLQVARNLELCGPRIKDLEIMAPSLAAQVFSEFAPRRVRQLAQLDR